MSHDLDDIQPGDIIVTSPAPMQKGLSPAKRLAESAIRGLTRTFQGSMTHAMMATGRNEVTDIRPELSGIQRRPLKKSLKGLDYVVMRPAADPKVRANAAQILRSQEGKKPYSMARAALTGANLALPSRYGTLLRVGLRHQIDQKRGVQCADAIASSYEHAGHRLLPDASLTSPAHLLAHPNLQVVKTRVAGGKIHTPVVSPELHGLIKEKMGRHLKVADSPTTPKVEAGDILLVSAGNQPWASPGMPLGQRLALSASEKIYRTLGPKTLGHFTHAGIVGSNGKVIEALDAVRETPLHKAIGDRDFLILRPPASAKVRRQAATHARRELGKPYSVAAMVASGANTLLPTKAHVAISKALVGPKQTRKSWMCGGLVAHAYDRAGHDMSRFPATPLVTPGHLAAMPKARVVGVGLRNAAKATPATLGVLSRNSELRDRYQEAGLKVASVPGLSRARRRALGAAHAHLSHAKPDWEQFLESTKKKSFVSAIQADPRSDDKLRRHVDQMSRLQTGRVIGQVRGNQGTYDIVRLRGGGLGCTCNDWRFKKSVAPAGQQECKHIREFKAMKTSSSPKVASAFFVGMREGVEKRASYALPLAGTALGAVAGAKARSKKRYDQNLADYSAMVHGAMSPELFEQRKASRARQGLMDTAAGAAGGALAGHMFKTKVMPKVLSAYGSAKKEISEIAGEASRKAIESAKDPAREIARQVARDVVDVGEQRIKHNLGKLDVKGVAQQAGHGLRKGLTPSLPEKGWFGRLLGKGKPPAEPNPIFSAY